MEFFKYHGTGNDFIIINNIDNKLLFSNENVVLLCDRHYGIGADGLILVKQSKNADFYMDFYNSDGSKAEMCGNGIRCMAAYLKDSQLSNRKDLSIETLAGIKYILISDGSYTVDMGRPSFDSSNIPVELGTKEVVDFPFKINDRQFNITCVSMGNPHTVIFGNKELLKIAEIYGPKIENSPKFPQRTNVEFVNFKNNIAETIVWERGVGLTLACGTGACAVLAAAEKIGKVKNNLIVNLPGGNLNVQYNDNGSILMTGPAEFVFKGDIKL